MIKVLWVLTFIWVVNSIGQDSICTRNLIGRWKYTYSIVRGKRGVQEKNEKCPVAMMAFQLCNDSIDMLSFSKKIRKMRKGNLFTDIQFEVFDTTSEICDTCYPVAHFYDRKNISVTNYCKKHKYDYQFEDINTDTLTVSNCFCVTRNGETYCDVKHVYFKIADSTSSK